MHSDSIIHMKYKTAGLPMMVAIQWYLQNFYNECMEFLKLIYSITFTLRLIMCAVTILMRKPKTKKKIK